MTILQLVLLLPVLLLVIPLILIPLPYVLTLVLAQSLVRIRILIWEFLKIRDPHIVP